MRLIYKEGGRYHNYYLQKGSNTVGRSPKRCDLVLLDSSVSKQHIELVYKPKKGEVILRDLGSSNGTLLNGQKIRVVMLADGDVIQIGQTKLLFVTHDEELSDEELDRAFGQEDEEGAVSLRPFLVIEDDEGERTFPLGMENVTIGHKKGNDIVVHGKGISRFHAEIYFDDNYWWIKDLNSRNGTYVNGVRIEEDTPLTNGAEIQIGSAFLTFQFPKEDTLWNQFMALDLKVRVAVGFSAAFLSILFLYLLFRPAPPQKPKKHKASLVAIVDKGMKKLFQKEYIEAERYFRKVRLDHPSQTLDILAKIALNFDLTRVNVQDLPELEKQLKLLLKAMKKELSQKYEDYESFVKKTLEQVRYEKRYLLRYQEALKLAKTKELSNLREAYNRLKEIPSESRLYSMAQKKLVELREELFRRYMQQGEFFSNSVDPNWSAAYTAYQQALEFCTSEVEKVKIRTKISYCKLNQRAKANFSQGERYYQDEQFDMARQYFENVPEDSYYYKLAQERLQDIQRLHKIAEAQRLYNQGEGEEAMEKLAALGGTQAKLLRRKIRKILSWKNLGEKAKEDKNYGKAIQYFQKILAKERNENNYYRIAAESLIRECSRRAERFLSQSFNKAVQCLEEENYRQALLLFEQTIQNDFTKGKVYKKKVTRTIQNYASELLEAVKYILKGGLSTEFPKARDICLLLKKFLPPDDIRSEQASEMLKKLY